MTRLVKNSIAGLCHNHVMTVILLACNICSSNAWRQHLRLKHLLWFPFTYRCAAQPQMDRLDAQLLPFHRCTFSLTCLFSTIRTRWFAFGTLPMSFHSTVVMTTLWTSRECIHCAHCYITQCVASALDSVLENILRCVVFSAATYSFKSWMSSVPKWRYGVVM